MASSEDAPDRTGMVAAGYAAASWARARRATWTQAPLAVPPPAPPPVIPSAAKTVRAPVERVEPPKPSVNDLVVPVAAAHPAAAARARDERLPESVSAIAFQEPEPEPAPSRIRLYVAAGVSLAAAAGIFFGARQWNARPKPAAAVPAATSTPAPVPAPKPEARTTAPARRAGTLKVSSTPDGARVLIDGKARGVTPLTVNDLAGGKHTVDIQSTEGSVQRSVVISPGETATVDESIFAGFVGLDAPFELTASESGRPLTVDERGQILLPPGTHQLHLTNASLAFEIDRQVEVKPGQVTSVVITPPKSAISVTAGSTAEVWVDGTRVGETPLFSYPVDIGTHDVLIRRPGGERRLTVTVTTKPLALNADTPR